jgi:hypothetical protein
MNLATSIRRLKDNPEIISSLLKKKTPGNTKLLPITLFPGLTPQQIRQLVCRHRFIIALQVLQKEIPFLP